MRTLIVILLFFTIAQCLTISNIGSTSEKSDSANNCTFVINLFTNELNPINVIYLNNFSFKTNVISNNTDGVSLSLSVKVKTTTSSISLGIKNINTQNIKIFNTFSISCSAPFFNSPTIFTNGLVRSNRLATLELIGGLGVFSTSLNLSCSTTCFSCRAVGYPGTNPYFFFYLTPLYRNPEFNCQYQTVQVRFKDESNGQTYTTANLTTGYWFTDSPTLSLAGPSDLFKNRPKTMNYGDPENNVFHVVTNDNITQYNSTQITYTIGELVDALPFYNFRLFYGLKGLETAYINPFMPNSNIRQFSAFSIGSYGNTFLFGDTLNIVDYLYKQINGTISSQYNTNGNFSVLLSRSMKTPFTRALNYSIGLPNRFINTSYPFGFGAGNFALYNHTITIPFSLYQSFDSIKMNYEGNSTLIQRYNNGLIDNEPPKLINFTVTYITAYKVIYWVNASDDYSGIYSISIYHGTNDDAFNDKYQVILYDTNLVNFTTSQSNSYTYSYTSNNPGVYFPNGFTVVIQDCAGHTTTFRSGQYMSSGQLLQTFPQPAQFNMLDLMITSSTFVFLDSAGNQITSDISVNTEQTININLMFLENQFDTNFTLRIRFNFYPIPEYNENYISTITYNKLYGYFTGTMKIPQFVPEGEVSFDFLGVDPINSFVLKRHYGIQTFNVTSDRWIAFPPYFSTASITPLSTFVVVDQNPVTIGWGISYSCQYVAATCRKLKGYIDVMGEYDPVVKRIPINYGNILANFTVGPKCRSQKYRVIGGYLHDGYLYSQSFTPGIIDPLAYIQNDTSVTIEISCTSVVEDNPPILTYFNMSVSELDVRNIMNNFTVHATICDDTELKINSTTVLYVTSLFGDQLKFNCTNKVINAALWNLTCDVSIPYRWGSGDYYISIYGIIDSFDNFNGYSTTDLLSLGYNSIIKRIDGKPVPIGPPQPTQTPTQTPTETPSETPVTPTPTQTPTQTQPPKCPGNPQCSNNGNCNKQSKCECNLGYFGLACDSKIEPIPQPPINPEQPVTNATIPSGNFKSSFIITIGELVEVSQLNETLASYNLTAAKWDLTQKDNATFLYTTALPDNTGKLTITIQWFSVQTNYTFAGKNFTILPSSIKYTITIENYQFKNNLSQLRLLMEAVFSKSGGECTALQTESEDGDSNNLKWIKMQIDKQSLYGTFMNEAEIDGVPRAISTELLSSSSGTSSSNIKVAIGMQQFEQKIVIDPNFNVLVDTVGANDRDGSVCNKKKGLSNGAIAGIVVGGVVAISLAATTAIFIYKRKKSRAEESRLSHKLSKMG